MAKVRLPHNYIPRNYQEPVLSALDKGISGKPGGVKRAVTVWHRRSGKDKTFLNFMIKEMARRVGTYYYFFPNYNQGRKILWDGIDKAGFPYMNHFPSEVITKKNNTEMKITTVFGSVFQIIGTDNIDTIVGSNPVGCVFSEYALQDPEAWNFIRPILRENGGWAVFNFTPRGRNHGWKMAQMAQRNPAWFFQKLTVDDTHHQDGTPYITPEMVQAERDEGMEESLIQQEYYCSFDASLQSCFFGTTLVRHKHAVPGLKGVIIVDREGDTLFSTDPLGVLEIWRFPYFMNSKWDGVRWSNRYAIGSDISEGIGHNYSVGHVFDRVRNQFVARIRSNQIDASTWADKLYLLAQFYDNALICAERTGAGITTIKRLSDLKARQYMRVVSGKVGSGPTKQLGWHETEQTKFDLVGDLKTFYQNTRVPIYDSILLDESASFIKDESGRLEADAGFLDDSVYSAGCTLQASKFLPKPKRLEIVSESTMDRVLRKKREGVSEWVTA